MQDKIRPAILDPTKYVEDGVLNASQDIQQFINKLIESHSDSDMWEIQGIVDTPRGDRQTDIWFGHIWVEQHESMEDSYYGSVWYPLPCETKWVQVWYNQ